MTLNEKMGTDSTFLEMLNVLLSETRPYEDKERLLREKFCIEMDADMRREVNLMCNLSESVFENGEKRGIRSGMKRGIKRGKRSEKRRMARAMLEGGYPEAEILKIVRISPEELDKLKLSCF